jgi:hypothetical protein
MQKMEKIEIVPISCKTKKTFSEPVPLNYRKSLFCVTFIHWMTPLWIQCVKLREVDPMYQFNNPYHVRQSNQTCVQNGS